MTEPTQDPSGNWPPPQWSAPPPYTEPPAYGGGGAAYGGGGGSWPPPGPVPPPGKPRPAKSFGRFLAETVTKAVVYVSALVFVLGIGMFASFIAFVGFLGVIFGSADAATSYDTVAGRESSRNRVLQIPIHGIILGESGDGGGGLFALTDGTYGYDVKEQLVEAAHDDDIGAVILHMDTPGGTIYGSAAIADGVREFKSRAPDKPIYAFVASMSASGGMYAMAGVDEIVADQGTLVGSIGVRMGPFVFYDGIIAEDGGLFVGGVETSNGITYSEITAGRGKDIGSPYRPMNDEERAVLQTAVDNSYSTFVAEVAEGRGLTTEAVSVKIGALIYDEVQARDLGLVDSIANRDATYARIAEAAGFPGSDWQVVSEPRAGGFFLFGAQAGEGAASNGEATRPTYQECFPGAQVLAFYGDPTVHCMRRR